MLHRLIYGKRESIPRWRDAKGNFPGWSRMLLNGTRATVTGFLRLVFGFRPVKPWISYSAVKTLSKFLSRENSVVLEFGSGMSTAWYAKHARAVYSVEDDTAWFNISKSIFHSMGISNVHYHLATNEEDYIRQGQDSGLKFDLIMVDGSYRSACVRESLPFLKPGGIIYLDNTDKDTEAEPAHADMAIAKKLLIDFAASNNATIEYYSDFAPTQLFAQQGMLVRT
jgi:precorrin-6B methylase 2